VVVVRILVVIARDGLRSLAEEQPGAGKQREQGMAHRDPPPLKMPEARAWWTAKCLKSASCRRRSERLEERRQISHLRIGELRRLRHAVDRTPIPEQRLERGGAAVVEVRRARGQAQEARRVAFGQRAAQLVVLAVGVGLTVVTAAAAELRAVEQRLAA